MGALLNVLFMLVTVVQSRICPQTYGIYIHQQRDHRHRNSLTKEKDYPAAEDYDKEERCVTSCS